MSSGVTKHLMKSDGFERAPENQGALLNADVDGLVAYKAAKKRFAQLNNVEQLMQRVAELEQRVLQLECNNS